MPLGDQPENPSVHAEHGAIPNSSCNHQDNVGASPTTLRVQQTSLAAAGRLMQITEEPPPEIESTARSLESVADAEDS